MIIFRPEALEREEEVYGSRSGQIGVMAVLRTQAKALAWETRVFSVPWGFHQANGLRIGWTHLFAYKCARNQSSVVAGERAHFSRFPRLARARRQTRQMLYRTCIFSVLHKAQRGLVQLGQSWIEILIPP